MHIAQIKVGKHWIEVWRQPAADTYKRYRPTGIVPWRMVDADSGEVVERGGSKLVYS